MALMQTRPNRTRLELIEYYKKELITLDENYPLIAQSIKEGVDVRCEHGESKDIERIAREKQRFETTKVLYGRFLKELEEINN